MGGPNGQNPVAGCTTAVNACGFGVAEGMLYDAATQRFYLSDLDNHRIIVFDLPPTLAGMTNGMAASKVLGHADLLTGEGTIQGDPFLGGERYTNPAFGCTTMPNACSLSNVQKLAPDPARKLLFASDFNAARVLVYGANVGGTTLDAAGNATSVVTIGNSDGSKTFVVTDTLGASFKVTLPSGTTPLGTNTSIN